MISPDSISLKLAEDSQHTVSKRRTLKGSPDTHRSATSSTEGRSGKTEHSARSRGLKVVKDRAPIFEKDKQHKAVKAGPTGPDVFDNLSKTLGRKAASLNGADRQQEKELRRKVVEALKNLSTDKATLGARLVEYKAVYKSQREWTRVVTAIAEVVDLSARTLFRVIEECERGSGTEEPKEGPDLSHIYGPNLTKEELAELRARLAIRTYLDNTPVNKKTELLAALIAEEVHQVWGKQEAFTIRIQPTESKFTFDGRKKRAEKNTNEVAA